MSILALVLMIAVNFLNFGLFSRATFTNGGLLSAREDEIQDDTSLILERSDLLYTDPDDPSSDWNAGLTDGGDMALLGEGDGTLLANTALLGEGDATLLANTASQGACVSQADDSSLYTRDSTFCQPNQAPALSPGELIFLQNFNNLPPVKDVHPSEPADPLYPGRLTDDEIQQRKDNPADMLWDLKAMGLEAYPESQSWECDQHFYPFPVCCDGPRFSEPNWRNSGLENCLFGMFRCKTSFSLDRTGFLTLWMLMG